MASGSFNLTSYYAKRIIGDNAASSSSSALLQTGTGIASNTWILNRTNRNTPYGISYIYDSTNNDDSIGFHGGQIDSNSNPVPSVEINLNSGNINTAGNMTIGGTLNVTDATTLSSTLDVVGATTMSGKVYINVTGDLVAGDGDDGALVIGDKDGANIGIDENKIIARNNETGATLYLNTGISSTDHLCIIQMGASQDSLAYVDVKYTMDASSSSNGAMRIVGGVGIGKKLYVGSDTKIIGNTGLGTDPDTNYKLKVDGATNITGATTLDSTLDVTGATTIHGQVYINNTTDVEMTGDTGALVIGDKTGQNIGIDGNEILSRNNKAANTLSLNYNGGDLVFGVNNDSYYVQVRSTMDASASTNGALRIGGGVGIAKKLYVGSTLNVTGAATFSSTINGLTLTAATTGFTIAGGTTSKTLTVNNTYTLAAACAKGVDTSIAAASTSANLPTSAAVATFVEGKGYTTNTGTVTSVTLTQGAGITVSSSGTAITTTGSRTISITGMDTTSGSTSQCLTKKGTWANFTNNAGTVTSITLTQGAGITVSSSGTAITSSGTRTISITGMDTSAGSTSQCLTKKGTWASFTNNAGTVTSITLTQGAGITVSSSGTAITSSGSRTISITGMDTSSGSTTSCLTQKGTWASFNNYTHPTTAGNKHVPSSGASGNILAYSAAGTAKWVYGHTYVQYNFKYSSLAANTTKTLTATDFGRASIPSGWWAAAARRISTGDDRVVLVSFDPKATGTETMMKLRNVSSSSVSATAHVEVCYLGAW